MSPINADEFRQAYTILDHEHRACNARVIKLKEALGRSAEHAHIYPEYACLDYVAWKRHLLQAAMDADLSQTLLGKTAPE
jgi:hypothetical protein